LNPGRSPQPSGTDPRDILTEQLAYYIAGAREYDETAYGNDPDEADARIAGVIEALKLSGDVLEIACGTGRWTAPIAAKARRVLALDGAESALALARQRIGDCSHVRFEHADAWTWGPRSHRFDVVFMAFWLSHVPLDQWPSFLGRAAEWLRPGGRLIIVDEHLGSQRKESWLTDPDGQVVLRTLRDGSTFRVIKVFVDRDVLRRCLKSSGLESVRVSIDRDWLIAAGRLTAVHGLQPSV
jgi:ubiquinone/menaquinone biosynthesis C-methylase UbiE